MTELSHDLLNVGVAVAIGAFVGLEREYSQSHDPEAEAEGTPSEPSVRAAVAAGEASAVEPEERRPQAPPLELPDAEGSELARRKEQTAGVRTHALLALAGALAAYPDSAALLATTAAGVALLIAAGYVSTVLRRGGLGLTSEVTAVVVFLLGVLCARGQIVLAAACSVVVTTLLSLKPGFRQLTARLRREDIYATVKFAILTVIVLPVLPLESIEVGHYLASATPPGEPGPWWASISISPRKVWYFVCLVSGVSFAGYVLGQAVGPGRGLVFTGFLGGLASSTAVSLAFSQRSRERPDLAPELAIGILLANAVMPVRFLVVLAVVSPALAARLAVPLLLLVLAAGATTAVLYLRRHSDGGSGAALPMRNPFAIAPALRFGLLFGVVLLLAQVARGLFGDEGLYVAGAVAGLTDVDGIGLATAHLVAEARVIPGEPPPPTPAVGATVCALAVVTNTVVKAGFVVGLGSARLRWIALPSFGLMLAAALGGIYAARLLFGE